MEKFNSFYFVRGILRKILNKEVLEEFRDLDQNDLPNIANARNSLKTACTARPNDPAPLLLLRLFIFYFIVRKAQDLFPAVAGMPLEDYAQRVTFRPQITLFFAEKLGQVAEGYSPLRSQVSVRIPNKTHLTISESDLRAYGNQIKTIFGGGTPYSFRRGKVCAHYHDKENGFQFFLYVINAQEAKDVLTKVFSLITGSPNWEFLTTSTNAEESSAYPTIPETRTIVGESRKMPRKRPVGTVYFTHATAEIYGVPKPIVIYTTDSIYRKALVN